MNRFISNGCVAINLRNLAQIQRVDARIYLTTNIPWSSGSALINGGTKKWLLQYKNETDAEKGFKAILTSNEQVVIVNEDFCELANK